MCPDFFNTNWYRVEGCCRLSNVITRMLLTDSNFWNINTRCTCTRTQERSKVYYGTVSIIFATFSGIWKMKRVYQPKIKEISISQKQILITVLVIKWKLKIPLHCQFEIHQTIQAQYTTFSSSTCTKNRLETGFGWLAELLF